MTRLNWFRPQDRQYETGIDRGVLYPKTLVGFSYSSVLIGLGSKTFAISPFMYPNFRIGVPLTAITNDEANSMTGLVTASSRSSVTIEVTSVLGSGTVPNWNLNQGNLAEAWNGLTGVDENGGENASTYYIDGRPFLFLPKPKEFSATIKAYTYPDVFSALMGIMEATDGMYLDSQMGDSFDLSYRTMIGSATKGEAAGYKIHLVYNATVVPSAVSYATLGAEVNPNEFSWPIQAVPVKVDGYRPTAHIIIDTRHMDPDRLAEIETLLYGDDETEAAMPTPQEIYDILSFGDAIIITDNGDGTWDAEGSYHNVFLTVDDSGEFVIQNVDATFPEEGVFEVSSTNV